MGSIWNQMLGEFLRTGSQHSPLSEEAVLAGSAYFSAGRLFQMYLPHLEKAHMLLGYTQERKTKTVIRAAKGGQESRNETSCDKKPSCGNSWRNSAIRALRSSGLGQLGVPAQWTAGMYPAGQTAPARGGGPGLRTGGACGNWPWERTAGDLVA